MSTLVNILYSTHVASYLIEDPSKSSKGIQSTLVCVKNVSQNVSLDRLQSAFFGCYMA